jgi:hypothetical protein
MYPATGKASQTATQRQPGNTCCGEELDIPGSFDPGQDADR